MYEGSCFIATPPFWSRTAVIVFAMISITVPLTIFATSRHTRELCDLLHCSMYIGMLMEIFCSQQYYEHIGKGQH